MVIPSSAEHRKIEKYLELFRIATAEAIIRNSIHALVPSGDMSCIADIAELFDDYALSILSDWLATKSGFPAYASRISEINGIKYWRLKDWPALCNLYPLANLPLQIESNPIYLQPLTILERHLSPHPALAGYLYEQIVEYPLTLDADFVPSIGHCTQRKRSGLFYTPKSIIQYAYAQALKHSRAQIMTMLSQRREFRLMDPSCGTGNFLSGFLDWLGESGLSNEDKIFVVENWLHGIDVDGRSAGLCRLILLIQLSSYFDELSKTAGSAEADRRLSHLVKNLNRHIRVSDSLLEAARSDIGGFDLVATNPPYISYGSRNQIKMPLSADGYLRKCYPDSAEYKLRLHSIFQDLSIRLARDQGKIVLLVPDAFLTGRYYTKLRQQILRLTRIESLSEFDGDIISGATVGRWCVAVYHKGQPNGAIPEVELYAFNSQMQDQPSMSSVQCSLKPYRQFALPLNSLVTRDRQRFRMLFNATDLEIWQIMDELKPLSTVLRGHTGIRSKTGQNSIINGSCLDENCREGIVSGSSVNRHCVEWSGHWLRIAPESLYSGGFDKDIVEHPKLLVRQTADRIICGYDAAGLYHLNNVHSFSAAKLGDREAVNLWYFDALMNSNLWLYLYRLKSRQENRALAQIDIEMLECMPIPQPHDSTIQALGQLCKLAAKLIKDNSTLEPGGLYPGKDTVQAARNPDHRLKNPPGNPGFEPLPYIERAIDRLVYTLYNLSNKHIVQIESDSLRQVRYPCKLPEIEESWQLVNHQLGLQIHL